MSAIDSSEAAAERPSKRVKLVDESALDVEAAGETGEVSVDDDNDDNEDYDDVRRREIEVGIIHFVNPAPVSITGLFKSRYTDFLVNEIDPEGNTLHLGTLKPARQLARPEDVEEAEEAEEAVDATTDVTTDAASNTPAGADASAANGNSGRPSDEDIARLNAHFNDADVVKAILALYESIVTRADGSKAKDHPVVEAAFTTDRSVRAQIHADIRRIFHARVDSHTDHSGTLVLSAAAGRPKASQRNGTSKTKTQGKLSWADRGGEHVHFNLYKENKDSMEMVNLLARLLKTPAKTLRIAGTKDRRAATVQRVSAYRVDANRLAALNNRLRAAAVGDFAYRPTGLELGQLSGNEFVIALREVGIVSRDRDRHSPGGGDGDEQELKKVLAERIGSLRANGWINYYGLQRFGSFAIRSDVTGLKILQGDFRGACDSILDYNAAMLADERGGDGGGGDGAGDDVGTDDRNRAAAIALWRRDPAANTNAALAQMPKRFAAETAVIRHLGRSSADHLGALLAIPRTQRTLYVHAYQSRVWNMAASRRWALYGARVVAGDLVLVHEHPTSAAAAAAAAADVADGVAADADGEVIVGVAPHDSWRRADDVFERARALTATEAASGAYTAFDVVLPTPGWDVEYPANASGDFYAAWMAGGGGGGLDPRDMRRKQRDFSLSGSYRKFLARVGTPAAEADVDVRRYARDDESLLRTDLDLLSAKPAGGDGDAAATDPADKTAAILRFRLGVSQYATMALRELSHGGVREYKPKFSGGR